MLRVPQNTFKGSRQLSVGANVRSVSIRQKPIPATSVQTAIFPAKRLGPPPPGRGSAPAKFHVECKPPEYFPCANYCEFARLFQGSLLRTEGALHFCRGRWAESDLRHGYNPSLSLAYVRF